MSDIFLMDDTRKLLKNKFIIIIGDSVQRAIYKDIVILLQKNKYLTEDDLKMKGEFCFQNDELIEGGRKGEMTNGVGYREVRQYSTDYYLIRFYFVTRCYNKYVESIINDVKKGPTPDAIIMNSCLWDISRYGPGSVANYKINLEKLFGRFRESIPKDCLIMWNSTLPISKAARGGFLIPEVEFLSDTLRIDILEANYFTQQLVQKHEFDVLDLHYYLRHKLQSRRGDGVHWDSTAHRRITNLVLTHVGEAWCAVLPGRVKKKTSEGKDVNGIELPRHVRLQNDGYHNDIPRQIRHLDRMIPARENRPHGPGGPRQRPHGSSVDRGRNGHALSHEMERGNNSSHTEERRVWIGSEPRKSDGILHVNVDNGAVHAPEFLLNSMDYPEDQAIYPPPPPFENISYNYPGNRADYCQNIPPRPNDGLLQSPDIFPFQNNFLPMMNVPYLMSDEQVAAGFVWSPYDNGPAPRIHTDARGTVSRHNPYTSFGPHPGW